MTTLVLALIALVLLLTIFLIARNEYHVVGIGKGKKGKQRKDMRTPPHSLYSLMLPTTTIDHS